MMMKTMMTSRLAKSRAQFSTIQFSMPQPVQLWWAEQTSKPLVKLPASEFFDALLDTEKNMTLIYNLKQLKFLNN